MDTERNRAPEGEPSIAIRCHYCNKTVVAKNVGSHRGWDEPPSPEFGGGNPALFVLYECSSCSDIFLAVYMEAGPPSGDVRNWDSHAHILYPASPNTLGASIPPRVGKAFEEAITCFESGAYTGCVLLCRKTLEGLCHAHGVNKPDLAKSLATMRDKKLIDDQLYTWASELRFAGNDAAHDTEQAVTRDVATDVIKFCGAIVYYTYTLRHNFRDFLKRRGKGNDDQDS